MIVERPKAFIPTEDQGYLIVVVQTPDGTSGEPTAGSSSASRQIAGSSQGVQHTCRARRLNVDHRDQPDQLRRRLRHRSRSGTSGRRRSSGPPAWPQKLQGEARRQIRDAMVLVLQPPPIRGLSQTGGFEFMIEDRDGQGGRGPPAGRRPVPGRGPQAARAGRRLHDLLGPGAPAPVRPRPHQGPAARRADLRRLRRRSRPTSAATTSTTSTSTARSGRSWSRPRAAIADQARGHRTNLYVLNRKGEQGPAQLPGRGHVRPRADRRAPLQPVRRRQDQRRARPGLQLGPGDRRDAGGGRRGPARGLRLRVDRHDLPGAEDRQPGDLHLRPLGRLRLPVHGGPLRELDPAAWSSS